MTPTKIVVVGSGAWGSALACVAARARNTTHILCRNKTTADEINHNKTNSDYLNDLKLEDDISATTDKRVLKSAEIIIFSVPAQELRRYANSLQCYISKDALLLNTAKGIELKNKCTISAIMKDTFADNKYAILSGPSFATEVAISLPTAVTIASESSSVGEFLCEKLSSKYFRCYVSKDVTGVEYSGALKNIYAIGAGICDGLELGNNAKAAFISRSIAEMGRIIDFLSPGSSQSLMGLSGLGDLQLTCATGMSRNYTFGLNLITTQTFQSDKLCEGVATLEAMHDIVVKRSIPAPILMSLYNVVYRGTKIEDELNYLLSRPLNSEL